MNIEFIQQRANVKYKIVDQFVYIKNNDNVNKVDFSNVGNGRLASSIDFISLDGTKKVDGELTVTLIQPLDEHGNELQALSEFDINESKEINFKWQTQEEIEQEENQPTQQERLEALENALLELILEGDNND